MKKSFIVELTKRIKKGIDFGKRYERIKAITLLNEIVNTATDLTPGQLLNERYEIKGNLFNEIYNFLVNNNLKEDYI